MPRLPALYRPKRRWALTDLRHPMNCHLEDSSLKIPGDHYASMAGLSDKVEAVLEDHVTRHQVIKLTEAEAVESFPGLVIASLGANCEDKPNWVVTARNLHDGTNGLVVNTRTRIRDQERSPIASDVKRATREKSDMEQPTGKCPFTPVIGSSSDVVHMKADQFTPILLGLFGVSSASYHFPSATWHMLVANDFHLEAGGQEYRFAVTLPFFILCAVAGVFLSWSKTAGLGAVTWVGFEMLHSARQLGISHRRAD